MKTEINRYNKIAVILSARIGSKRLPKKALLPIAGCDTMLELIIKRLKTSQYSDDCIVAIPENSYISFESIFKALNCNYYIGSEEDVLDRYVKAAEKYGVSVIVRTTGDNPLVSIKAMDLIIEHHINTKADLSHYDLLPYGSGVEVINYEALKYANDISKDIFEHEHITRFHYRNPNMFKIEFPKAPENFIMPDLITTIDTKEQYEYVNNIFKKYDNYIYTDVDRIIADIKYNEKK